MTDLINEISKSTLRAAAYGCLAKLLGPNTTNLSDKRLLQDLTKTIKAMPAIDLEKEMNAVKEALNEERLTAENLNSEYTRLFIKGACPPYETSYDIKRKFVKTHDLADIAGFYMAFGIKPRNELPDHIVSELEFMGLLCLKEAHALANSNQNEANICIEAQRKFLSDHLGIWLSAYSQRINTKARLKIFSAIANLTHIFVMLDAADLGVKLETDYDKRDIGRSFSN